MYAQFHRESRALKLTGPRCCTSADEATTHFVGQSTVKMEAGAARATGETYCLAHHVIVSHFAAFCVLIALPSRTSFLRVRSTSCQGAVHVALRDARDLSPHVALRLQAGVGGKKSLFVASLRYYDVFAKTEVNPPFRSHPLHPLLASRPAPHCFAVPCTHLLRVASLVQNQWLFAERKLIVDWMETRAL